MRIISFGPFTVDDLLRVFLCLSRFSFTIVKYSYCVDCELNFHDNKCMAHFVIIYLFHFIQTDKSYLILCTHHAPTLTLIPNWFLFFVYEYERLLFICVYVYTLLQHTNFGFKIVLNRWLFIHCARAFAWLLPLSLRW